MRHVFVLGITSFAFFLLAGVGYRYDVDWHNAKTAEASLQLNRELLKFEIGYFQAAQVLLQLSGDRQLLEEVKRYESLRQALPTRDEQEVLFQSFVTRVKARLMETMEKGMNESLAQEWRRASDQMQGALTRRTQVIAEIQGDRSHP